MNHGPKPILLLFLLLSLSACRRGENSAVPLPSLEGRMVLAEGPVKLLAEPGLTPTGFLPAGMPARVANRMVDESGSIWLELKTDSLSGWAPESLFKLAEGRDGRIATH